MMNRFLFFTVFLFMLIGCSNKQLYQAGQDYQKSDCIRKAASELQYNNCLNSDKKSYEAYEKARKDIIKK